MHADAAACSMHRRKFQSGRASCNSGMQKQKQQAMPAVVFNAMVRPERFELPTAWFVARYSIQLSYGRVVRSEIMLTCCECVNAFVKFP